MKDEIGGYDEMMDLGQDYKPKDDSLAVGHELCRG